MDWSFINPTLLIQFTTLMFSIVWLIFGILLVKRYNGAFALFVVPLLTYAVHVIIHYSVVLYLNIVHLNLVYNNILLGWGAGVRLHLALLLFAESTILFYRGDKWMLRK
jgi:hypothetical protein